LAWTDEDCRVCTIDLYLLSPNFEACISWIPCIPYNRKASSNRKISAASPSPKQKLSFEICARWLYHEMVGNHMEAYTK
jgi:hypothetical protein